MCFYYALILENFQALLKFPGNEEVSEVISTLYNNCYGPSQTISNFSERIVLCRKTIDANNHEQDAVVENAVDDSHKIQPQKDVEEIDSSAWGGMA